MIRITEQLAVNRLVIVRDTDRFRGVLTPADILQHPHRLVVDCTAEDIISLLTQHD